MFFSKEERRGSDASFRSTSSEKVSGAPIIVDFYGPFTISLESSDIISPLLSTICVSMQNGNLWCF